MVQKQPRGRAPRRIAGEDYFTVREAADELGVSPSTIWRWIDAGQLAASRVGPRAIRIQAADVKNAVRKQCDERSFGDRPIYTDVSEIPEWTEGDKRDAKRWLAELNGLRQRLVAERRGRLFPDSARIIREERDKRSQHQADLADKARR